MSDWLENGADKASSRKMLQVISEKILDTNENNGKFWEVRKSQLKLKGRFGILINLQIT